MEQDDKYSIAVAKSEYRNGYNEGNVDKVLSVFAPGFIDMSEGQPSYFGSDARKALEQRLEGLFRSYQVSIVPLIIDVVVNGDAGFDYGWHKVTLTPRGGGDELTYKARYFERWSRQPDGQWKIAFIITNRDEEPRMEPLPEEVVARKLCQAAAT